MIYLLLGIILRGEPQQPAIAADIEIIRKNISDSVSLVDNTVHSNELNYRTVINSLGTSVVATEAQDNSPVYIPFGGTNWQSNAVWNESYPYTDDGLDYWPHMSVDGLGTIWAIYTGTTTTYTMDTVFVFCSTDNGQTWLYRVAIYTTSPNYDPQVARLSVDRVNNWVYISTIAAQQAGGGNFWPGTLWITRFQHIGNGNIVNLGTYLCDPQRFGEIYARGVVACDGSGSSYIYAAGLDWTWGYLDFYRSNNRGVSWTYLGSLDLGGSWTNVLNAGARYGSSGAIISWVEWDDAFDSDSNSLPENDYDVWWGAFTSSGQTFYYFDVGGAYLRDIGSVSYYGNRWIIPFDESRATNNFDIYFYHFDGTNYWLYTLDNSNIDYRSPAVDAFPNRFIMAYYMTISANAGRPFFYWADASDVSTWYSYTPADPDVINNNWITVSSAQWKFIDVTYTPISYLSYSWQPHVGWRRTVGVTGGGDLWHSWPSKPSFENINEEEGYSSNQYKICYLNKPISNYQLFNLAGARTKYCGPGIYIIKK